MFVWLLSDWLCEIEWNLKLFESLMRGNEMTFPGFLFDFWSLGIQIHFIIITLVWRWHDFFHLKWKGFLKKRIFEFHLKVFQIHKLYATQWFSWGKIKWLLQSIWNMSWKYEERFEDGLNFFKIQNHLELFGLFRIIFLQN